MEFPAVEEVRDYASHIVFGDRLIQNNFRAVVAEAIVDFALRPTWLHCSENWGSWDFQHTTGVRLEVKQSSIRQSWKQAAALIRGAKPQFDIAARTGYWHQGTTWIEQKGRHAHIYVFALHSITDDTADHRDALQWKFYIVAAPSLPPTKTISLSTLKGLSQEVGWHHLFEEVEAARIGLGFAQSFERELS